MGLAPMANTFKNKLRNILFIFGLGTSVGFYFITCVTIILAFLHGGRTTIVWTNLYGEAAIEFFVSFLSMPCVVFMAKESIDLYKKNKKGCILDEQKA